MDVEERDLRAHDVGLVQFELIPGLTLLLTVAGVINCGLATAREFEDLTIKELTLAPMPRGAVIAGKMLAGWLTTLLCGSCRYCATGSLSALTSYPYLSIT